MNTKEKGDQLEDAIERLENTILGKYIGNERPEIVIERNKKFVVDDVEYRPDLVITLYPKTNYESIIIFECKNWKDQKVKREKISDFASTVDAIKAAKGYFIANSFNEGAINKAKTYERVELLKSNDDIIKIYEDQISFKFLPKFLNEVKCKISLVAENNQEVIIPLNTLLETDNREKVNLHEILLKNDEYRNKLLQKCREYYNDNNGYVGTIDLNGYYHEIDLTDNSSGDPIYLTYNKNYRTNSFKVYLLGCIYVYEVRLVARFDIEKKGRYTKYEMLNSDGVWHSITQTEVKPLNEKKGLNRVIEFRYDPPLKF